MRDVLKRDRFGCGDNGSPVVDKTSHFIILTFIYGGILVLEQPPIDFIEVRGVFQPEKAVNMGTALFLPFITIPEMDNTE